MYRGRVEKPDRKESGSWILVFSKVEYETKLVREAEEWAPSTRMKDCSSAVWRTRGAVGPGRADTGQQ